MDKQVENDMDTGIIQGPRGIHRLPQADLNMICVIISVPVLFLDARLQFWSARIRRSCWVSAKQALPIDPFKVPWSPPNGYLNIKRSQMGIVPLK